MSTYTYILQLIRRSEFRRAQIECGLHVQTATGRELTFWIEVTGLMRAAAYETVCAMLVAKHVQRTRRSVFIPFTRKEAK